MSDIKLFSIKGRSVQELAGSSVALEKSLQTLIEQNLEAFLGVTFLATEYSTGKTHGGRIDTLGIDENHCPVIIEYKRALNENVINQGLFYLDWLMDHKADFKLKVMEKLDETRADNIEWGNPRLICIAGDFTKYDEHAIQQINRNIELVRYRKYGDEFLILELANAVTTTGEDSRAVQTNQIRKSKQKYKTVNQYLEKAPEELKDRFEALKSYLLAIGDDVQMKTLKNYFAFRRIKNFACVEVHPQTETVIVFLKLNPKTVDIETLGEHFARDVSNIGHFGTGDLELRLKTDDDLEKAKPLILKSYEIS
jgi:predicted transport protein